MLNVTSLSHLKHTYDASPVRATHWASRILRPVIVPLGLIAFALLSISQTGCSTRARGLGNSLTESLMVDYRDAVWSRRAYNIRYGNCDRPFSNHYRDGFCAGYEDVCNGGDGYVPALPPSEYRGYEYQCAEGAKCVNTWFEGYPKGVAAAKQDRSGDFKDMFISRMVNSAVIQDKAKHVLPGDVPIIKPDSSKGERSASSESAAPEPQAPPNPIHFSQQQPATGSQVPHYQPVNNFVQASGEMSVMQTEAPRSTPPIVSARPSNNSPLPMPINRQARAQDVISNQYAR